MPDSPTVTVRDVVRSCFFVATTKGTLAKRNVPEGCEGPGGVFHDTTTLSVPVLFASAIGVRDMMVAFLSGIVILSARAMIDGSNTTLNVAVSTGPPAVIQIWNIFAGGMETEAGNTEMFAWLVPARETVLVGF